MHEFVINAIFIWIVSGLATVLIMTVYRKFKHANNLVNEAVAELNRPNENVHDHQSINA